MTKHFLKTLTIFAIMIVIGLLGVLLITNLGNNAEMTGNGNSNNGAQVAK